MAFDFFEIHEPGSTNAVVSYRKTYDTLKGSFACQDMLRQFAKHTAGEGTSMVSNFKFDQATEYTLTEKAVEREREASNIIWNGRSAEDIAKYYAGMTQVRTQGYRMQVYPLTHTLESGPINNHEAVSLGGGDREKGVTMRAGADDFVRAMLNSETLAHNYDFLMALRETIDNGIYFRKTRMDGGIDDSVPELHADFPDEQKYLVENDSSKTDGNPWLSVADFVNVRQIMAERFIDVMNMENPLIFIMSPKSIAKMINNNNDKNNLLSLLVFGPGVRSDVGQTPNSYGITFYQHPAMYDNKIYAIMPGTTVECFDWGTYTESGKNPDAWEITTIRRTFKYAVKVTQPLSFMEITLDEEGSTPSRGTRWDALKTATGAGVAEEILKPIRKNPNGSTPEEPPVKA